jgi:4-amino-4-deoxy-L-arabinose transferase-like glycosyltransferase
MPLYVALLAAVHFLIWNWVDAARVVSSGFLILTTLPLYLVVRELFDRRAAFWACIAYALAPLPNTWVVEVLRGPVFVFCLAWGVYLVLRAFKTTDLKYIIGALALSWLALGFRVEGVILILFGAIFLIYLVIFDSENRKYFLKTILIWVAFPLLIIQVGFIVSGSQVAAVNRLDQIYHGLKQLVTLRSFENYQQIYQYLKSIETADPFSGWRHNFATLARHYMPVIYLLGLLALLLKVLFPVYLLPLAKAFQRPLSRGQWFVTGFIGFYLLMIYYSYVTRDFISTRFVFVPAFFLYAWVGLGMTKITGYFSQTTSKRVISGIVVFLVLSTPVVKIVKDIAKRDSVIPTAGRWLGAQAEFRQVPIASNDPRILLYAGHDTYGKNEHRFSPYTDLDHDFPRMEQLALQHDQPVFVVSTKLKRWTQDTEFKYYKKVKEFIGNKKVAIVYVTQQFFSKHYSQ